MTDVQRRVTAMVRWDPPNGVHPLDLGGLRQDVATGGSVFDSNLVEQEPGNGSLVWGKGASDALVIGVQLGPDRAPVPRMHPRGANCAIGDHRFTFVGVTGVRVRARLIVIVGEGSRDLLPCTEVKDLRCKATTSALVVESDASDADEN